jgi:hypothetical protein
LIDLNLIIILLFEKQAKVVRIRGWVVVGALGDIYNELIFYGSEGVWFRGLVG